MSAWLCMETVPLTTPFQPSQAQMARRRSASSRPSLVQQQWWRQHRALTASSCQSPPISSFSRTTVTWTVMSMSTTGAKMVTTGGMANTLRDHMAIGMPGAMGVRPPSWLPSVH